MKIAATFNCDIRHNGTAAYALRALKEIEGVEAFHVRVPDPNPPPADAYLYVDDGRDDLDWTPPHPSAYWAIDTHLGYGYRLHKARSFDRVFVAQREAVTQMRRDGIKNVEWLPLACHPDAHLDRGQFLQRGFTDEALAKLWDFAFVGFMNDSKEKGHNNRVDYLDALFARFPNSWLTTNVFFEDMALRFVKARMGFNVSIKRDLNMRVFEVMSTGTPLFTNRDVDGIEEFFEEGVDYVGYHGMDEMLEVAREALDSNGQLARIGASGHAKVRAYHTYSHRMMRVLEALAKV